jgi:HK97 family phage major capsid protein
MELKEQFEAFAAKMEGKSKVEVKEAIGAFEVEVKGLLEGAKEEIKGEFEAKMAALQGQADAMDAKLQAKAKEAKEAEFKADSITSIVKDNFNEIKNVQGKSSFNLEVKDMTLGSNLVGDQPRDYNNDVVKRPAQLSNVEDLTQTINISGGTYTYTRSTLTSGSVAAAAEGATKNELVYTYTMVDANTDYIAGISIYSKKMRNNLTWMESTLSTDLRRDYYKGENAAFQSILAAQATASVEVITGKTKAEMLVNEISRLENQDFSSNGIALRPSDWADILKTPKDDLAAIVTFENGMLTINGVRVYKATWIPANKYYVGDWSRVRKVVTEGFSFAVSEEDNDNFSKNNITARVEAQVTLTVEQPDALVYGDFTAV